MAKERLRSLVPLWWELPRRSRSHKNRHHIRALVRRFGLHSKARRRELHRNLRHKTGMVRVTGSLGKRELHADEVPRNSALPLVSELARGGELGVVFGSGERSEPVAEAEQVESRLVERQGSFRTLGERPESKDPGSRIELVHRYRPRLDHFVGKQLGLQRVVPVGVVGVGTS